MATKTPCFIIKEAKTGKVIERMEVTTTNPRSAARSFKGLMMRMDRDRFVADDSEVSKALGPEYLSALSSLVR